MTQVKTQKDPKKKKLITALAISIPIAVAGITTGIVLGAKSCKSNNIYELQWDESLPYGSGYMYKKSGSVSPIILKPNITYFFSVNIDPNHPVDALILTDKETQAEAYEFTWNSEKSLSDEKYNSIDKIKQWQYDEALLQAEDSNLQIGSGKLTIAITVETETKAVPWCFKLA